MASRVNLNQHPHQILLILISTAKLCSNSQVVQISSSIQSHPIQSNIYLGDIVGFSGDILGISGRFCISSAIHPAYARPERRRREGRHKKSKRFTIVLISIIKFYFFVVLICRLQNIVVIFICRLQNIVEKLVAGENPAHLRPPHLHQAHQVHILQQGQYPCHHPLHDLAPQVLVGVFKQGVQCKDCRQFLSALLTAQH